MLQIFKMLDNEINKNELRTMKGIPESLASAFDGGASSSMAMPEIPKGGVLVRVRIVFVHIPSIYICLFILFIYFFFNLTLLIQIYFPTKYVNVIYFPTKYVNVLTIDSKFTLHI